jgi:hypothetical protein
VTEESTGDGTGFTITVAESPCELSNTPELIAGNTRAVMVIGTNEVFLIVIVTDPDRARSLENAGLPQGRFAVLAGLVAVICMFSTQSN